MQNLAIAPVQGFNIKAVEERQTVHVEAVKACPSCNGTDIQKAPEQPGPPFGLTECNACGLIFLSPRPPEEEMQSYYDEFYADDAQPNQRQITRARRHFGRLRKLRPEGGRLLEIGAGDGYFLHTAKQAGWEVNGVELSEPRVKRAKEWFDVDLVLGNLETANLPKDSFDAIVMFQLVEHLHDPMSILKLARSFLKPKGLIFLSTPNALAYVRKKRSVNTWRIPRHLFFFTPKTLTEMMERCGFRVVGKRTRLQSAAEEKFNWRPWKSSGGFSGVTRDLWTPFGLRMVAERVD